MGTKLIAFHKVSFSYETQLAVSNANFSVSEGDFLGVIGPNGGGKTTLIKLILGFLQPDEGSITLFGQATSTPKDLRRIGYVPQKATNFDNNFPATVFEVASMGRVARRGLLTQLSKQDDSIVEKALADVDMLRLRDKRVGDLSGGQQQRVFIARALAAEPELLILDEPFTGVDMESQHKFYALLKKLNKEKGLAIILVSHDISMVTKALNKVVCVNVNVTVHDITKGFTSADLACAYPAGFAMVPHHHD